MQKKHTQAAELPWIEKHRPLVLSDIVGNEATINRLSAIAKDGKC